MSFDAKAEKVLDFQRKLIFMKKNQASSPPFFNSHVRWIAILMNIKM